MNNPINLRRRIHNIIAVLYPLYFGSKYLKGKRWVLYSVISISIITSATRLLIPVLIGDAVSSIQSLNFATLEYFAILILIVSAVSGFFQFFVNYGSQYISQLYAYGMRKNIFDHLMKKKFLFFETQTSGDLLSRSTMDVDATRNFIMNTTNQLLPTLFMILFSVVFLFILDPIYSLIFIVTVPALILTGVVFQRKQRLHWRKIRTYYGDMNEELQENIVGNRVVRGFSIEDEEIKKFSSTTNSYFDEYMDVARLRGFYNNLMPLTISIAATAILLYGGYTSIINASQVGNLVAAVNIFSIMTFPISFLGRLIVFSENARAGIQRINVVLSDEMQEDIQGPNITKHSGDLEIKNVSFQRGKRYIFRGVNLKIPQGEIVCITGKTASGKSSFVNLIPRFYEPTSGIISIGGRDISQISLSELRRTVALVPQEITLLSGTIMDNITLSDTTLSMEAVMKAARIADIGDFIDSLPEKYNTRVGERGITLSGGQRQRVAIARAIVAEPKILILDDATSSVDPETELEILKKVKEEMSGTTVLIVTHRDSAIKFADRVLRLQNGSVEEIFDITSDLKGITDGYTFNNGGDSNAA
ncbi:MAG: ABC transporter ATP-binding protein [Thermoplasmataceae archaeon]|jgi:ABC-type multidrug transport system fused ATPase/permease subunit